MGRTAREEIARARLDMLADEHAVALDAERRARAALEAEVLNARVAGLTQVEIVERTHLTPDRVRRLLDRAGW